MVLSEKAGVFSGRSYNGAKWRGAGIPNQAVSDEVDSAENVAESRVQSLVLVEAALSTSGDGPTILITVNDDGVLHWPHSAQ
jgi:hypothetical protein